MGVTVFSQRLKEYMDTNDLRQTDIIIKCQPYCRKYNVNISRSMMSQWLSGYRCPGKMKLFVLATALNVSEAWLMGYDSNMNPKPTSIASPDNAIVLADAAKDQQCMKLLKNYMIMCKQDKERLVQFSSALALIDGAGTKAQELQS